MDEFHWEYYKHLNPDLFWSGLTTPQEYHTHYLNFCKKENRKSKFSDIYPDFDWIQYRADNPHLQLTNESQCQYHRFITGLNPKPKFGFFLIGFGEPLIEQKINILKHNLEVMKKIKEKYQIDLYIYIYSVQHSNILKDIDFSQYVSNVYIHVERGIIGEFIYKYVSKMYINYDYSMLFLDDIEFHKDMNIDKVMRVYNEEKLDILGFPLTKDSPTNHEFMYVSDMTEYTYRQTNFIEFFTYFISNDNFGKFLQFFNKYTKWCWGIDISLHNRGVKMGIYEIYPIRHYFKATSYSKNLSSPIDEWIRVKNQYITIKNKIILKKEKY